MTKAKSMLTPFDPEVKLSLEGSNDEVNPNSYRKFVGKLIYLIKSDQMHIEYNLNAHTIQFKDI